MGGRIGAADSLLGRSAMLCMSVTFRWRFFNSRKQVMHMKIADHLSSKELQHMNNLKNKDKSTNNKSNEKLSDRDLAELMGTNRPTYRRVRGAIRRK
ncbi:hypothetical protein [Bacillus sp. JJ1474]|uniref:hypothetical protein n=1 Tax=Bacillus sp. JJ1474 TaxID=3122955 RepID=UPI0030002B9D